ncbi:Caspase-1 [Papilio xuthus]|uniref:Caspase-1 n=1 Tax=Papilio xuthus TaxID=66420 RepID=A0A194Q5B4_PAPXU|nr:Caspase-1 [Papilio xuthus]
MYRRSSDGYFENSIGEEYVVRKRRGKKKGKGNINLKTNQVPTADDSDANMEELENDDEKSISEVQQIKTINNIVDYQNPDEDMSDCLSRVSVDGVMKAPPQIQVIEPEPYEKNKTYSPSISQEEQETILYNNRALSKHAVTYELEKFEKNCLIIFNQENVDGFKPRHGTEKDVQALKSTFSNYGFEVTEHKDFTKDEVFRELMTFSERDFTDYGCVAVAVLTHGSHHGLLRAKDLPYSEIEIINHFKVYNKPTLVTKPKILIIQAYFVPASSSRQDNAICWGALILQNACRGKNEMQGVPVFHSGTIRKDFDESLEPYTLPAESDMLILHSSYIGHPSHRDELYGSWFIQALCHKINQLASTHDFESIVTEVKREVAVEKYHEEYNRRIFEMDVNKQMPVTTSTLIRKLYLKKYGDDSPNLTPTYNRIGVSSNEVLDNSTPSTPLLVHFGPCSCFLDHFAYVRRCLSYHVEENPHDITARSYLEISESFEDSTEFNTAKRKMAKAISNHLNTCAKDAYYFKYLYFYKHGND